jgi:hypothetical protein
MYRPLFRPQYPDPTTTLDWSNCTMASGAMALDFHTQGKVQMWGGELRKLQSDQIGGTDLGDLQRAWLKAGYILVNRSGKSWNDCIVDLKNGKGVVLQGDYDVFTGADTCQGSFNGDHAVYLNPEFFDGGTTIAVGDPLCKSFKRIKITTLKAYAEKFGTRVLGKGQILYAVTRAWPDPIQPQPQPPEGETAMPAFKAPLTPTNVRVEAGTRFYRNQDFSVSATDVVVQEKSWHTLVGEGDGFIIAALVRSTGPTGVTFYVKPSAEIDRGEDTLRCAAMVTSATDALTKENKDLKTRLAAIKPLATI